MLRIEQVANGYSPVARCDWCGQPIHDPSASRCEWLIQADGQPETGEIYYAHGGCSRVRLPAPGPHLRWVSQPMDDVWHRLRHADARQRVGDSTRDILLRLRAWGSAD